MARVSNLVYSYLTRWMENLVWVWPEGTRDKRTEWRHLFTIAGTTPQWLVNSEGSVNFSGTLKPSVVINVPVPRHSYPCSRVVGAAAWVHKHLQSGSYSGSQADTGTHSEQVVILQLLHRVLPTQQPNNSFLLLSGQNRYHFWLTSFTSTAVRTFVGLNFLSNNISEAPRWWQKSPLPERNKSTVFFTL